MSKFSCDNCKYAMTPQEWDKNWSCPKCHCHTATQIKEPAETLRDKFAAAWLTGHVANPQEMGFTDLSHAAEYAYKVADAMLKAREVKHD